jgi:ribosomal protein S18 acetylase RimI-like enzyme
VEVCRRGVTLCGDDPSEPGRATVAEATSEVARTLGWTEAEHLETRRRWVPILHCIPGAEQGTWVIENVATLPEFGRCGLATALLAEALDVGRQRGYRAAQISVLVGNTAAERAYERVGFAVVDERRQPDFEAVVVVPGIRLMVRAL